MKRITTVLSIILLLALLLSSCNMDSNTGLFQDAALSEKKESYTIHSVLAKDNDNSYLVSSTDGVFLYTATGDNSSSKKYLTGNDAKNVLYAKIADSKWELVYYSEKESKWYKVTEEKVDELITNLEGKKFSSSYTDLNGNYAFVLKDDANINYVYYGTDPASLSFIESKFTDVKYFGDGYFIGEDNNSKRYIFKPGDIDKKEINDKDAVATFGNNTNNYILKDGSIYIDGVNNKNTSSDSITDCSPLIHEEGDNIYIILKSTNNFYIYNKNTKTIETKECVGLKDVEIKAITGVKNNGESINVIIANSKARSINLKDKLLSDWIK